MADYFCSLVSQPVFFLGDGAKRGGVLVKYVRIEYARLATHCHKWEVCLKLFLPLDQTIIVTCQVRLLLGMFWQDLLRRQ